MCEGCWKGEGGGVGHTLGHTAQGGGGEEEAQHSEIHNGPDEKLMGFLCSFVNQQPSGVPPVLSLSGPKCAWGAGRGEGRG